MGVEHFWTAVPLILVILLLTRHMRGRLWCRMGYHTFRGRFNYTDNHDKLLPGDPRERVSSYEVQCKYCPVRRTMMGPAD